MTTITNPNGNMQGIDGYDDSGHQVVKIRAKNVTTDSSVTPNVVVGDLGVEVEVNVQAPTASSSALTSAGASITAVQLLAANTSRKGFSVVNDGTANLYIAYGNTPTTTSYKYHLMPGALLECGSPVWLGTVSGIWDVANGSARVSEES